MTLERRPAPTGLRSSRSQSDWGEAVSGPAPIIRCTMGRDTSRSHPLDVRVADIDDADVVAQLLHDFNVEFDTSTPGPAVLAERLRGMLGRDDIVALLAGDPAAGIALLTFRPCVWDSGPAVLLE